MSNKLYMGVDDVEHPLYFLSDLATSNPVPYPDGACPRVVETDEDGFEIVGTRLLPVYKEEDCMYYERCLTWAACRDLDQFSCDICPLYEGSVIRVEEVRSEDPLDFLYAEAMPGFADVD